LCYELLKDVKEIKLPYIHPKADSIYNQFTIVSENRDELMKELQAKEIGCAIYYPLPLHVQECFAEVGQKEGDCPIAERLAKQVVSIPIYSELTEEQIRFVAETIINFYK